MSAINVLLKRASQTTNVLVHRIRHFSMVLVSVRRLLFGIVTIPASVFVQPISIVNGTTCVPSTQSCPMFETLQNGTCQCSLSFTRDPNCGRCICPSGYQLNNGTCVPLATLSGNCVCPENEYYDYSLKKCRCIAGYYRDPITKHCLIECIYCDEFEVYNSTVEACVCLEGYVRLNPQANCTLP
jgi:hypothetical protein